jgi:hypothetical protein
MSLKTKLSETDLINLIRDFGKNPNFLQYIGKDITENILDLYPNLDWDWKYLSLSIKLEYIYTNKKLPWDWGHVSYRAKWDDVKANPGLKWNWEYLSGNPNITWEIVRDNSQYPWKYDSLCLNRNITGDIVRDNPKIKWSYLNLSKNFTITMKFIEENIDKDWDFKYLSKRADLDLDLVFKNMAKKWDYDTIITREDLVLTPEQLKLLIEKSILHFNEYILNKFIRKKTTSWSHIKVFYDLKIPLKGEIWDTITYITSKKDITLEIAQSMPLLNWNWKNIVAQYKNQKLDTIHE